MLGLLVCAKSSVTSEIAVLKIKLQAGRYPGLTNSCLVKQEMVNEVLKLFKYSVSPENAKGAQV